MAEIMGGSKKSSLKGKRALVVGMAESGVSAARLLDALGAKVLVTDARKEEELIEYKVRLPGDSLFFLGGHESVPVADLDFCVISPGIPWNSDFLKRVRSCGVRMVSELEFGARYIQTPIVAITGTNGKTTTTTLLSELLKAGGKRVFTGGNIGTPLSEYVLCETPVDYVVCEVSSFQLEGVSHFRPAVSLILNITPDHLDRHKNMGEYAGLKERIFENQGEGDVLILNADDAALSDLTIPVGVSVRRFSASGRVKAGAYAEGEALLLDEGDEVFKICEKQDIPLRGGHNVENVLAAALAARLCRVGYEQIRKGISGFTGIAHRMEVIRVVDDITFVNDSKGTNVGAAEKSIKSFDQPVILIAGGKDKGGDYTPLIRAIKERVRHLVLIGEAGGKISGLLNGYASKSMAVTMDEAVLKASEMARSGDVVLLSPACSSFDMFNSYRDRGDAFRESVLKISKPGKADA